MSVVICIICKESKELYARGMCTRCYKRYLKQKHKWERKRIPRKEDSKTHKCKQCKEEFNSSYMEQTLGLSNNTQWFCKWCLYDIPRTITKLCAGCGRLHQGETICVDCKVRENRKKYDENGWLKIEYVNS